MNTQAKAAANNGTAPTVATAPTAPTVATAATTSITRQRSTAQPVKDVVIEGLTMDELLIGRDAIAEVDRFQLPKLGTAIISRYRVNTDTVMVVKVYRNGSEFDRTAIDNPAEMMVLGWFNDDQPTVSIYNGGEIYRGLPLRLSGDNLAIVNAAVKKLNKNTTAGKIEAKRARAAQAQAQTDELWASIGF